MALHFLPQSYSNLFYLLTLLLLLFLLFSATAPSISPKHSSTMAALREIVIPVAKGQRHAATVICMHGLGDSGAGWSFLAENWRRRGKFEDVQFIFPNAPSIPITVNGGMRMPGWYDIVNFDTGNRTDDEAGIMRTRNYIHNLVYAEVQKGVPAKKVILGGFSQGAAMSIFAGLTFNEPLAGVFALSGYQLLEAKFDELRREGGGHKPPVFMGHGEADPLVRYAWGKATEEGLRAKGFDLTFKSYPGLEHSASLEELDELEKWVTARLQEP